LPAAIAAFFVLSLAALLTPAGALAVSASASPGSDVITYEIGINQDYDGMNPFSSRRAISTRRNSAAPRPWMRSTT